MQRSLVILTLFVVYAAACGKWMATSVDQPFPKDPYVDPYPLANVNGSIIKPPKFFCGLNGKREAGVMLSTDAGYLCVTTDINNRMGSFYYPGAYSALYYKFLNDPKLIMSTVDDPIPKNAIMWFDWGSSKNAMAPNVTKYATYLCAGVIDVGLVPGQLFIDPYSGQPVCYVTMIYSLGIVGTPFPPGRYYNLVGSSCLL